MAAASAWPSVTPRLIPPFSDLWGEDSVLSLSPRPSLYFSLPLPPSSSFSSSIFLFPSLSLFLSFSPKLTVQGKMYLEDSKVAMGHQDPCHLFP